ncbi:glycosyltransferase family 25 protein [Cucurbitaria berberidis CBS 394.84]|uniref:Glycosyltransferase family 25 protein n=1 Tax=Cucurbitaria berberidis CBS 394.84 TaxID=1168544 RepID=A0A9P4GKL0_9PLEO|nr:glycosyltransferase family 25 protein [Cucurbitaria berberidis CBS 394.84]KAF1848053.1 glycosyltransferase family 25 protein [Cucurbitaria berberidis CBS 394.84]
MRSWQRLPRSTRRNHQCLPTQSTAAQVAQGSECFSSARQELRNIVRDGLHPANATLGFGTILAVSHIQSPRRRSLLWAANLTDLEVVIPDQEDWTEGDVQNFRAKEGSSISKGSALAWLGHLDALRWFLNTTHETALIIEDDVDWDMSIRQTQIPLLAAAVRVLLANNSSDTGYWSHASNWDLLYPGHCDDLLSPSTYLAHPHLLYRDDTTPQHTLLHPDTFNFLHSFALPEGTRFLHRAFWPFCTFAYAVTRRSASLILAHLSRELEGGTSAFDVALLASCRDLDWRCWSVSPELFHHTQGQSEISRADGNGDVEVGAKRATRATWNIGCGARHAQLWMDESDVVGRRELKALVEGIVERGECPVDGVEEEKGWKGCEWGECGAQS